ELGNQCKGTLNLVDGFRRAFQQKSPGLIYVQVVEMIRRRFCQVDYALEIFVQLPPQKKQTTNSGIVHALEADKNGQKDDREDWFWRFFRVFFPRHTFIRRRDVSRLLTVSCKA